MIESLAQAAILNKVGGASREDLVLAARKPSARARAALPRVSEQSDGMERVNARKRTSVVQLTSR